MKKLMFAFACAASVCAFAGGNATGFEEIAVGTQKIGMLDDGGGQGSSRYFCYQAASDSTDGSVVKAFNKETNPQPDNLTFDYVGRFGVPAAFAADETNDAYLELSTEGGTLWRNYTNAGQAGEDGQLTFGDPVQFSDLPENQNIYVDTLVQFTPTEDGTTPAVSGLDQMAIWLNVDSTNPDAPETNLCVYASLIDGAYNSVSNVFKVTNAEVIPGKWYRLTVKAFADVTRGSSWPGFMVYLDGKLLETDTPSFDSEVAAVYSQSGLLAGGITVENLAKGSVFCSLWLLPDNTEGTPATPSFTAVGFKGSGAIDDLVLSTDVPNFFTSAGALDFILKWDANVSAVSYTLGGATYDVTDITAGEQTISAGEATEVTVTATAKDWYTIATGNGLTTINTNNQVIDIETALATTPEAAGANKLAGISTEDAKAWATGKGISISAIEACDYAKNAFLMNTGLEGGAPGLEITAITEVADGWEITVKGTQGEGDITLEGINGALQIKAAATLADLDTATPQTFDFTLSTGDGPKTATIKVTGDNKNFMKATVGVKATTPAE